MLPRTDWQMIILRLLAWLAGAVIGYSYITNHWIPGLIFGGVVVMWHWSFVRSFSWGRYALFVLASTLNYALVLELAQLDWPNYALFSVLVPAVVAGTVLLPVAHKFVLGASIKRVVIAIPVMYFSAYLTAVFIDRFEVGEPWSLIVNFMAAWQLAYLITLRPEESLSDNPESI